MSRINKTQFAILGCLSKHQTMSGYDIKRLLEKVSAFYWSESNSQLYPLLKKLVTQAMITVEESTQSGRPRNLYTITDKGLTHLCQWLTQEVEMPAERNELLLKISLGQHSDDDQLLSHIDYFSEQIKNKKRQLKTILQHIRIDHDGRADQKYLLMTYRHSELILEAQEKWSKEVKKEL